MRASDAMLKLCDHYVPAALDVPAFSILQVVSIMLTLLLTHEYTVRH